jgi:hypothetical protein
MRVQASIQFSCATTGLHLETQLSTETRNLAMFRQGHILMVCTFCGQQHRWRLIKYNPEAANRQIRSDDDTLHAGGDSLEIR